MYARRIAALTTLLLLCALLATPSFSLAQTKAQPKAKPQNQAGTQQAEGQPQDKPSGSVTMDFGQGGFIVSANGGHGVLRFKGRTYRFNVGGLGVGGFGISKIKAEGEVYNLKDVRDFPGTFVQGRIGYAAGEGKGRQWLENTNGVVLKLRSVSKGLALNLGGDGIVIEMAGTAKKK